MTGKRYGTDDDVIFRTKHVKLKSMEKFNKRCLLQDGYAEHVQTCHIFHRQNFIVLSLRFPCEAQNFSATPRRACSVIQYCALGSAKTSRVDIDLIPEPGRVRTNPRRIQSPELSLEPSPELRPSLASSQAPSPGESLRIKPSCRNTKPIPEPRCRYELRTKLSEVVPSLEPDSIRSKVGILAVF